MAARTVAVRGGSVALTYEEIGDSDGIGVIIMNGGQTGRAESRPFAHRLATAARMAGLRIRIVLHDRRNMGTSDIAFPPRPLCEEEAHDLHGLIAELALGSCVVMGSSSGARTALLLALHWPADVIGLVLAPPTGGGTTSPLSIRNLSYSYYLRHVKNAREGGMAAVIARENSHYSRVASQSAFHRRALLAADVGSFIRCMDVSAAFLGRFAEASILGLHDEQLAQISQPTLVVHHGREEDKLHSIEAAEAAVEQMPATEPLLLTKWPLGPTREMLEAAVEHIRRCTATGAASAANSSSGGSNSSTASSSSSSISSSSGGGGGGMGGSSSRRCIRATGIRAAAAAADSSSRAAKL